MRKLLISFFVVVTLGFFTVASAQLPSKIEADKNLIFAEQLYTAKNYSEAFATMQKVLALQQEHSFTLSDEFHFRYAQIALSVDSTRIALGTGGQISNGNRGHRRALQGSSGVVAQSRGQCSRSGRRFLQ